MYFMEFWNNIPKNDTLNSNGQAVKAALRGRLD